MGMAYYMNNKDIMKEEEEMVEPVQAAALASMGMAALLLVLLAAKHFDRAKQFPLLAHFYI